MDFSKFRLAAGQYQKIAQTDTRPSVLEKASAPVWNRLEASPRGEDFQRALKAEVRDALWMMTRQWQMGEFAGEDAGTPVFADLRYNCAPLRQDSDSPLEPKVERQPLFPAEGKASANLHIRVEMGFYWFKLLSSASLKALGPRFIQDPKYALDTQVAGTGDILTRQYLELCKGRSFDGYLFYLDNPDFRSFPQEANRLKTLFGRFQQWYANSYLQPAAEKDNRWQKSRLEYSDTVQLEVKMSDPQSHEEKTLQIPEYAQGDLDWFDFGIKETRKLPANPAAASRILSKEYDHATPGARKLIPTPVRFEGMPESRYWTFEDGGTNFASIEAGANDSGRLALIEFGLIYANDWSLLPIKVPVGSYVDVEALTVVDSFGKTTKIPPLSQGSSWDKWSYFSLDRFKDPGGKPDNGLFFPPTLAQSQKGTPLEEVQFIRDEMANLVWGIETLVPTPLGASVSGREPGAKSIHKGNGVRVRYQKKTALPRNWIPFQPVQAGNKLVLRRGVIRDEETGQAIRPLTGILRFGLKADDSWDKNYDLEDGEVSRDGILVRKAFQRARWTSGEVLLWIGLEKRVGRGEGSSGLSFDKLEPSK